MRVELSYGRGKLPLELDDSWRVTVIRKTDMPVVSDPAGAVASALAQPVGAPPLAEAARGKRSACILVCDITRPVPNRLFLPQMVRQILDAGVPADKVTLLIATGLHRPNEGDELLEVIGDPWVLQTVKVVNHFAQRDEDCVDIGVTTRGNRVKLNRLFVEAELKIATGLVEPHLAAGWSGGRKVIAPGIAHRDTITTFHNARYVGHPKAANCILDGNPIHEDQLEIVKVLGGALALNTVIDEHRRLSFVNYGEIIESHLQAVDFCSRYTTVPVERRFRTVVTSNAGHPLDRTYYQTIKGLIGAMAILEPGGNLIVASECAEGLGSADYVKAQRRLQSLGIDQFLADIRDKPHAEIDEWTSQLLTKPLQHGRVHLYATGLKPEQWALTFAQSVQSLEQTVRSSVEEFNDPQIAVIPEGPYVVPYCNLAA